MPRRALPQLFILCGALAMLLFVARFSGVPVAATTAAGVTAQEGQLDPTFGAGGRVAGIPHGASSSAEAVALRADGKIVAAGWSYVAAKLEFATARFNANALRDTTFPANG